MAMGLQKVVLLLAVALAAANASAAGPTPPVLTGAYFTVQIGGLDAPGIKRVEFWPAERDRPRTDSDRVVLRLTRLLTQVTPPATDFLKWVQQSDASGPADRRDISITIFDVTFVERGRITLVSCIPLSWGGPLLSGDAGPLTESIDVRCPSARLSGAF